MTASTLPHSAAPRELTPRDHRAIITEIALQDFNELTELMAGFDMGERLLFNGLVSKAFERISCRCADPSVTMERACSARYKLFEFLRCYKELRGVGAGGVETCR
jgi:hypothetical protein